MFLSQLSNLFYARTTKILDKKESLKTKDTAFASLQIDVHTENRN